MVEQEVARRGAAVGRMKVQWQRVLVSCEKVIKSALGEQYGVILSEHGLSLCSARVKSFHGTNWVPGVLGFLINTTSV